MTPGFEATIEVDGVPVPTLKEAIWALAQFPVYDDADLDLVEEYTDEPPFTYLIPIPAHWKEELMSNGHFETNIDTGDQHVTVTMEWPS